MLHSYIFGHSQIDQASADRRVHHLPYCSM
jgi:hypothetical protein